MDSVDYMCNYIYNITIIILKVMNLAERVGAQEEMEEGEERVGIM